MNSRSPYNIILAEDDPDDRHVFSMAIKETFGQANITGFDNGQSVIHSLLSNTSTNCDVLFLDINMPRMNGIDCLREIKDHIQFSRIPIVMLTTSSTKEDVMDTFYAGATRFITKPPTYKELLNLFTQVYNLMRDGKLRKTDLFNYVMKPEAQAAVSVNRQLIVA